MASSSRLEVLEHTQVFFGSYFQLPENISDDKDRNLFVGGNDDGPHLVIAPVHAMAAGLTDEVQPTARANFSRVV